MQIASIKMIEDFFTKEGIFLFYRGYFLPCWRFVSKTGSASITLEAPGTASAHIL